MATVTDPSTALPENGDYMLAEQVTDWVNAIINFLEAKNIDAANVDDTSSDGVVTASAVGQVITGAKVFRTTAAAAGGVRTPVQIDALPVSGTTAVGDGVEIKFLTYASSAALDSCRLQVILEDVTALAEYAYLNVKTLQNAVSTQVLSIGKKDYALYVNTGAVYFPGTWQKPVWFGALALWYDSGTAALRLKVGAPASATDGYAVAVM